MKMMPNSILIKSAKIIDNNSSLNGKVVDILVENAKISKVESHIDAPGLAIFDATGLTLSLGWFDVFASCPDPGEPWKESLDSLSKAAAIGGFSSVAALCGTNPMPGNSSVVEQIVYQASKLPITIFPMGLASDNREGKEMAEVFEMNQAGAIAQTDGIQHSPSVSLRSKLMQYCASLNIPYLHFPFESKLVSGGSVHEGFVHVNLGLKGLPTASETIALLADIELAKWLNVPLRILGISSHESVEIVRKAKKEGVDIKVAVPIMNLVYDEMAIADFDENFKVIPPLRTEQDRNALVQGVLDGTIDAIFSNHQPSDIESKNVEFDYAHFGAATLPFFFPMLLKAFGEVHLAKAIETLTKGSALFFGIQSPKLEVNQPANFTIFNLDTNTSLNKQNKGSIAYNVLGLDQVVSGKIVAVVSNGILTQN